MFPSIHLGELIMAFKSVFIAKAPDADKEKHRSLIDTGKYHLHAVVVKTQEEALQVCAEFVRDKGVVSILLCPGFTHSDVAEIVQTVGSNVGVGVARGDGPSSKVSMEALKREGFF